ncbi:MAG TPA: cytochrome c peroxidase [Polyangiaceae bacterium]|nr:cytochrome c peroxidase [Polyangiaceae bacterium]
MSLKSKAVRAVAASIVAVCGCASNPGVGHCDLDGVSAENCAAAHEMLLPTNLPVSRGNKFADDISAAQLGFALFFDSNLGGGTSCATCHAPELAFSDHRSVSKGKDVGTRNSPTTFNSAYLSVFFWDGRADSLWSQPLGPLENPVEMASSRLSVLHFMADHYRDGYESVFGPLGDVASWPASGKPGDAAYDALSDATKDEVNRMFSNVGKALDAYMRKNASSAAALDAFLKGDDSKLIPAQKHGLSLFLENQCQSCHSGPMLSDQGFHNVGFPSLPGAVADLGRAQGVPELLSSPFNLDGPYADVVSGEAPITPPVASSADVGAFRTPSLRNVALTFPYGHDGALASLSDVMEVHAPNVSASDRPDLLVFLQSLNGAYPLPPWNNWPTPQ